MTSPFNAEGVQFAVERLLKRATRDDNGCLISHLKPNAKGYIYVSVGGREGKRLRANRLIFEFYNGPLQQFEIVRHTCDNRACIEPSHLIRGTNYDNSQDMIKRNRVARLGRPAIPVKLLLEAKQLQEAGYSLREIAKIQGLAGASSAADRIRRANDLTV